MPADNLRGKETWDLKLNFTVTRKAFHDSQGPGHASD